MADIAPSHVRASAFQVTTSRVQRPLLALSRRQVNVRNGSKTTFLPPGTDGIVPAFFQPPNMYATWHEQKPKKGAYRRHEHRRERQGLQAG